MQDHFKTMLEDLEGGLASYQSGLWEGRQVDRVLRSRPCRSIL